MLMFAIVLIGIATTAAAKQWKVIVQRELEADLLAKGIEIQNALALYSATIKAGCARSILIQWGMENGNIFGRRQAASWGSEARVSRSHSGSTTFPLPSGISRDAPLIMIGFSNTRVPHQLRSCHKGVRPVLWRHQRRDRRSLLAETLQSPSQLRGSRP
jgi:hypothetical protein